MKIFSNFSTKLHILHLFSSPFKSFCAQHLHHDLHFMVQQFSKEETFSSAEKRKRCCISDEERTAAMPAWVDGFIRMHLIIRWIIFLLNSIIKFMRSRRQMGFQFQQRENNCSEVDPNRPNARKVKIRRVNLKDEEKR